MKSLDDMTEPELARVMTQAARAVTGNLPEHTLFVLLAFGGNGDGKGGGIAQYISNAERDGIIKTLRETADRLEAKQDVTR